MKIDNPFGLLYSQSAKSMDSLSQLTLLMQLGSINILSVTNTEISTVVLGKTGAGSQINILSIDGYSNLTIIHRCSTAITNIDRYYSARVSIGGY